MARALVRALPRDGKIIGITGSVGKTSTKLAIAKVLSERKIRVSRGNLNTDLGLPLAILGDWSDKEIALVPGKVLSDGELTKKMTIAAFQFSKEAMNKINKKGKAITIKELIKENPKGKNVRIIG